MLLLFWVHLIGVVVLVGVAVVVASHALWKFPRLSYKTVFFFIPIVLMLVAFADTIILYQFLHPSEKDRYIIDMNPFPEMVSFVINWLIPCIVVVAAYFSIVHRASISRLGRIAGIGCYAIACGWETYLGYYLYNNILDLNFRGFVWWL